MIAPNSFSIVDDQEKQNDNAITELFMQFMI